MTQRSDRPTARERINAHFHPDGCCGLCEECVGLMERIVNRAERAARAEGFREGQERMRERCLKAIPPLIHPPRTHGTISYNAGLLEAASAIRALEVDDA